MRSSVAVLLFVGLTTIAEGATQGKLSAGVKNDASVPGTQFNQEQSASLGYRGEPYGGVPHTGLSGPALAGYPSSAYISSSGFGVPAVGSDAGYVANGSGHGSVSTGYEASRGYGGYAPGYASSSQLGSAPLGYPSVEGFGGPSSGYGIGPLGAYASSPGYSGQNAHGLRSYKHGALLSGLGGPNAVNAPNLGQEASLIAEAQQSHNSGQLAQSPAVLDGTLSNGLGVASYGFVPYTSSGNPSLGPITTNGYTPTLQGATVSSPYNYPLNGFPLMVPYSAHSTSRVYNQYASGPVSSAGVHHRQGETTGLKQGSRLYRPPGKPSLKSNNQPGNNKPEDEDEEPFAPVTVWIPNRKAQRSLRNSKAANTSKRRSKQHSTKHTNSLKRHY